MKWKCKSFKQKRYELMAWHKCFAWFPVRVGLTSFEASLMCWLETVERRHDGSDDYYGVSFIYRKPKRIRPQDTAAGRALMQKRKA